MKRSLALASSVAGAAVVALDGTVLTVAQPTLRHDLHASFAQVQWTSTGYLVAVASLLVFAGRLGDRYGHRRAFAVGMLGFGAASVGIALAPDIGWVIGLRVVQGVFGALSQPATLGMLRVAYPPERLRRPIAVRTAAIGLAAAAGPVIGGALATSYGWRAVFLVNIVPALVFGVLALASPGGGGERVRSGAAGRPALDVTGALLLAVALAGLVHTLASPLASPGTGGPGTVVTVLVALIAGVAGLAFVRHERRTPAPLLPPDVIGSPMVGAALALLVTASATLNGALFACVHLLQDGLGLTPLRTALLSLPLAVLLVAAAPASAVLLRRAGARATLAAATAVLTAGLLVLAGASGAAAFCVGFGLLGAGFGTVMVAGTHVVVRRAPVESAGVAGGLQQTAMNVGPALGVAAAALLMDLGGSRLPLAVLAAAAAAAIWVCRRLPGRAPDTSRPRPAPPEEVSSRAGRRDTEHTGHGVERGSWAPSLGDDEC
ncbi:MFS transporter [Streptomyces sp. NPDC088254]|uniref:MFS transporter n=1 Tax=Streptomyces sp. NPDC088254 TaxID=3365847 RepID=UPI0038243FA5